MKYLKLFNDFLLANLQELSLEESGNLIWALTLYSMNGSLTDEERKLYLSGDARFAFKNLQLHLDKEIAAFESAAARSRANGAKHTAKAPEQQNPVGPSGTQQNPVGSFRLKEKEKEKEKENILSLYEGVNSVSDTAGTTDASLPSLDEVKAYYTEIQSLRPDLEPDDMAVKFHGYYATYQGKDGKPWKSQAYSWFINEKKNSTSSKRKSKQRTKKGMGADAPYQQKKISDDEFDALFDDLNEGEFDSDETVE